MIYSLWRCAGRKSHPQSITGGQSILASFVHYDKTKTLGSFEELTDKSQQSNIASLTVTIIVASSEVVSTLAQILSDRFSTKMLLAGLLTAAVFVIAIISVIAAKLQTRQVEHKYEAWRQKQPKKR